MNAPFDDKVRDDGVPAAVLPEPSIARGVVVRAAILGFVPALAAVLLVEIWVPPGPVVHVLTYLVVIAAIGALVGVYLVRALQRGRSRLMDSLELQARMVGGVAEGIGQGMVVVDADGATVHENAIHRAIFGSLGDRSTAEWSERAGLYEIDGSGPVAHADLPLMRSLSGEVVRERALLVRNEAVPEGRRIRISSVPVRDPDGAVLGAIGMFSDVTEETSMAEKLRQVQRLDAIGQLTGGLAHDFNNLLTVILGNAGAIVASEAAEQDPTLAADARLIEDAAQRGSDLTHRLLAFARRQTLNPVNCDANVLVRDLLPLLERTLGSRVRITAKLYDEPLMVRVDVGELENALVNLAVNARDAMDGEGRIEIVTSIREPDASGTPDLAFDGPVAVIAVADDGPGIPEQVLSRVFEPFFTTKAAGSGSGLGLSMVHGFAHQSGGTIRAANRTSGGARFEILLPVATSSAAEGGGGTLPAEEDAETMRVLVVEDDEHVGRLFRRLLERMGYAVVVEIEAQPALDRFEAGERYDLLVSDIVLPGGMDGIELVGRVLDADPQQPVMMCSGYDRRALEQVPSEGRVVEILKKPFQPTEFEAMVRRLIRRRSEVRGGR
jgi:signal transduction histidine kinase/ActR/RegA family two-component response regulator